MLKVVQPITNPIVLSIFNGNRPTPDMSQSNLELEDGYNLLQEDGGLILLE
tara:strand:- start:302 stop:454 length:153 start_codon:yes stop_codon:yes gene_type:complete